MNGFFDLEDAIFQAHCQLDYLQNQVEEGAVIESVRDDVVTLVDSCDFELIVNLEPVQRLLDNLRAMK
jgi:hypothetical protein